MSTYLGGSALDYGRNVAVDSAGYIYIAGFTLSSDFPVTAGTYDTTHNGGLDIFLLKLTPAGDQLVFSTFVGGSGNDAPWAMAVSDDGAIYLAGDTQSTNFPVTAGAFDTSHNGGFEDAFILKMTADGSGLLYSTYLGGTGWDIATALVPDGNGAVYISGETWSNAFPSTPDAYDATYNGQADVFATRLNADGSDLLYSTYLGGAGIENPNDIALANGGEVTITGRTASANFPTTASAFDQTYGGDYDAFVTQFNTAGDSLVYSTYLGAEGYEEGRGVASDGGDNATVTGFTGSAAFPTTAGAYDVTYNGNPYDVYVTRLSADGSGLIYSTFLGGNNEDRGLALALDALGKTYVTGYTLSVDFPTTTAAGASGYYQKLFVASFSQDGRSLGFSTVMGGNGLSGAVDIVVPHVGDVYVTGNTDAADFPTSAGTYDTSYNGLTDAFALRLLLAQKRLYLPSILQ
ncbi:MAG: SBBP repeat-containing protein [Chloroflexota bacterium]